jgi:chemotaxis protein histidine kinase CheA
MASTPQATGTTRQPAGSAGGDSNHSRSSSTRRARGRGRNPRNGRDSTPRRSRHDTRDFADPNELRGIIHSIEERFETLRRDQQQGQEELQTRLLHSQDTIMQLLQEIRRDGPGPTLPRHLTDASTTIDNRLEIHIPDREILDEVHPSIEKGVEFDTISGAATRSTTIRPGIRNRTGQDTDSTNSPLHRNLSVPMSISTPRLSKNVPESDPLDDGTNLTFT